MPIDHVLIAVREPQAAAQALSERHGLAAVEGGLHPAWGTGNWIVPDVPIAIEPGPPAIVELRIGTAAGPIALETSGLA